MQTVTVNLSQVSADWNQNPRRKPEADEIRELASSIRSQGLLAPMVVARVTDASVNGDKAQFRVIAGYRRYEACRVAELREVPVVVVDAPKDAKSANFEHYKTAVVENEQRKDLSTYEQAVAYKKLTDGGMTQKEVSAMVGKAQQTVGGLIAALKHSEDPGIMDPAILEAWKKQGPNQDSGKPGVYIPMSFLNSIGSRTPEQQRAWLGEQERPTSSKSAMDSAEPQKGKRKKPLPREAQILDALSNLRAMGEGVTKKDEDDTKNYILSASMYLIGFLKDPSLAKREISALSEAVGTDSFNDGLVAARDWTAGKGGKKRLWVYGDFNIFPTAEGDDGEGDGEDESDDE